MKYLTTLLTVLFVGLKLAGIITWSWWWVLSPLWVSLVIGLLVCMGAAMFVRRFRAGK